MGRIDYKSGLLLASATIPGAILGALNTSFVPRHLFDIIFGVLLMIAAVFLSLRPNLAHDAKKVYQPDQHLMHRHLEAKGQSFDYAYSPKLGLLLSLLVGYASSFLGIGGGIIHVPVLVYLLNFPIHVATATSHMILAIMALTGTLVHIVTGTFPYGVHHMISLGHRCGPRRPDRRAAVAVCQRKLDYQESGHKHWGWWVSGFFFRLFEFVNGPLGRVQKEGTGIRDTVHGIYPVLKANFK